MRSTVLLSFFIFSLLLPLWARPAVADEAFELPAGGEPVLGEGLPRAGEGDDVLRDATFDGRFETVDVAGQPFERATQLDLQRLSGPIWAVQMNQPTAAAVTQGDVLVAEFYVKGKAKLGAECLFNFVFEEIGGNYTKSAQLFGSADDSGWKRFVVPFEAHRDFAPGEAQVAFHLGHEPQRIAVGGLRVLNYRDRVTLDELPDVRSGYRGSEPDAPWRAEAQDRIDRLRKADLTVRVVDRAGRPVAGAEVEVEMTRHAFNFGTAVSQRYIDGDEADTEDGRKYREVLLSHFNYATAENFLKPRAWDADEDAPAAAVRTVDWFRDHGMTFRGHNLLWPSFTQDYFFPQPIREGYERRAEIDRAAANEWLRAQLRDHVARKAMATRGRVVGWDVANEVSNLRDVMDDVLGGDDELVYWFKLLRDVDPKAEAYLNDYGILVGGGGNSDLRRRYKAQARYLLDRGAPLDALGVQGHFSIPTPPTKVWAVLDDLYELGVPIEITEFDIISGDDELNGRYTRDFLTLCFAHEGVKSFIVWGFWEGKHWRPEAAFYTTDWQLKPSGEAWRDLVLDEWWTRETLTTDANGEATVRGFLGDYRVSVGEATASTALPRGGRTVRLEAE